MHACNGLQYRSDRHTCTHRLFNEGNITWYNDGWLYGLETALHEMLMQSQHRTLDPEVITSCLIIAC